MTAPVDTTWLLTREAEDAVAEAEVLTRHGLKWASVPCIECVTRPWPTWPHREGTPVLFLTSRRAAAALPHGQEWRRSGPKALIASTAPGTKEWLEAHGHHVDVSATGGAEGLARALALEWQARGQPEWHLRYPTSDAGLQAPEQANAVAILKTLGPVDRAVVYETKPPAGLEERLEPHLSRPYGLSFSSPSAVKAFFAAVRRGVRAPERVVCFGGSTARTWDVGRPEGWPPAELAELSAVDTIVHPKEKTP